MEQLRGRPGRTRSRRRVIGFLNSGSAGDWAHLVAAFKEGLTEAGYVEGRNVAIEYRWSQGENEKLPNLAADLVRRQVNVIAAFGPPAAVAAKAATSSTPIVFIAGSPASAGRFPTRPGFRLCRGVDPEAPGDAARASPERAGRGDAG